MNSFFVCIFKKMYFLILFVMLSLMLVNFSVFTVVANHNAVVSLSRMMNEKDFFPVIAYVNCFIAMWLSVICLKRFIKKEIKDFSKQINFKRENIKYCLFTKVNDFGDGDNCFLQLRV